MANVKHTWKSYISFKKYMFVCFPCMKIYVKKPSYIHNIQNKLTNHTKCTQHDENIQITINKNIKAIIFVQRPNLQKRRDNDD